MKFLGLDKKDSEPESSTFAVLPVPFEQTSTFGCGSAQGPAAIIEASREVELFDAVLNCEPYRLCDGIATLEPVMADTGCGLADILEQRVMALLENNQRIVTLGGEHSSVVGAVRAHTRVYQNLTVVQFDAHSDLRETYQGSPWNHACAMSRILDVHDDIIQVGIRSQAIEERRRQENLKLPVFYAHELHEMDHSGKEWVEKIVDVCRDNVYITFDCDVFDPSIIPATGTPEPGGLTWYQVDRLVRRMASAKNLVGFDISELSPIQGLNHPQFTVAKMIYRWMVYSLKEMGDLNIVTRFH